MKIKFVDKLYPRANLPPSLRPIACFALEIARFVCDLATRIKIKKLQWISVALRNCVIAYAHTQMTHASYLAFRGTFESR